MWHHRWRHWCPPVSYMLYVVDPSISSPSLHAIVTCLNPEYYILSWISMFRWSNLLDMILAIHDNDICARSWSSLPMQMAPKPPSHGLKIISIIHGYTHCVESLTPSLVWMVHISWSCEPNPILLIHGLIHLFKACSPFVHECPWFVDPTCLL